MSDWYRLEPKARADYEERGLEGAIHDPLWLLSRQQQLYEFRGEDAGSPVDVATSVACDEITSVELRGDGTDGGLEVPYDGGPLESLFEREPVLTAANEPNARLRAEAGSHFLRLLADAGAGEHAAADFPERFRIERPEEPMPADDRQYFRVMAGRALDGRALYEALRDARDGTDGETDGDESRRSERDDPSWENVGAGDLPLPIDGEPTSAHREAIAAYYDWYRSLYDEPADETGMAWDSERLEYDASIVTGYGDAAARFDASAYGGGHLDWRSFSPASERPALLTGVAARPSPVAGEVVEVDRSGDDGDGDRTGGTDDRSSEGDGDGATGIADAHPGSIADGATGGLDRDRFADVGKAITDRAAVDEIDADSVVGGAESIPDRSVAAEPSDGIELPEADPVSGPIDPDLAIGTELREVSAMPTQIDFPGVPARRWWEFADGSLALDDLPTSGLATAGLLVYEYGLEYGADWFRVPLDVPVGTYARITDVTVTDSFGVTMTADPVAPRPGDWRLYTCWTDSHDEPGLLLPPTLSDSIDGDPIERVLFGRDEMANLAFGLERLIEGPTGRPLDRTEFRRPDVAIERVEPADDPAEEYVVLGNPGDDVFDLENVAIERTDDGEEVYRFEGPSARLDPGESIRVYTGSAPDEVGPDPESELWAGREESIWEGAEGVDVRDLEEVSESDGDDGDDGSEDRSTAGDRDGAETVREGLLDRFVLEKPDAEGSYRLSTTVPPHWFPFTMDYEFSASGAAEDEYRFQLALLLDAETLDAPIGEIPRPEGAILNPEDGEALRLYEEEITRSGREVSRRYQLARWFDGSTRLWSGRRSTTGAGELASGLRFDVLDEE